MFQQRQAVGNTVSDLTGPRFEPQTFRSREERDTDRPPGRCPTRIELGIILYMIKAHFFLIYKPIYKINIDERFHCTATILTKKCVKMQIIFRSRSVVQNLVLTSSKFFCGISVYFTFVVIQFAELTVDY